jgi:hypothetical protein
MALLVGNTSICRQPGLTSLMERHMQFPAVSGQDLLRRKVTLPAGLEGRLNLVLVAFQRWHQARIDSWLPAVAQLESRYPGLRHYELPVLSNMGLLSRTFINEGMRAGIPDPATRAGTITLYLDKPAFLQTLDLPGDDDIYLLLIDREGTVLWRASGGFTEDAAQSLEAALESLIWELESRGVG